MIDTDKYEGHTPGPWVALHRYWRKKGSHGGGLRKEGAEDAGNYAKSLVYTEAYLNAEDDEDDLSIPTLDWGSVVDGVCIENMATANLVADAPILLAEVKRMNKLRKEIQRALDEERTKQMEDDEWSEYDRGLAEGWVESLEYVLRQIEVIE